MKNHLLSPWFWVILIVFPMTEAFAGITVFDCLTPVGTPVYLKILTKGKVFPRGGQRVSIYIDGAMLGKTMSGGDGYAYVKYVPTKPGLREVRVQTDEAVETGFVLALGIHDKLIGVEIIGGLRNSLFYPAPIPGSQPALNTLIKRYPVVYFSRPLTTPHLKKWLKQEKFPESVTISWTGTDVPSDFTERGISFYMAVGSAPFMSELPNTVEKRFTFEETEHGETVADWNVILKALGLESP